MRGVLYRIKENRRIHFTLTKKKREKTCFEIQIKGRKKTPLLILSHLAKKPSWQDRAEVYFNGKSRYILKKIEIRPNNFNLAFLSLCNFRDIQYDFPLLGNDQEQLTLERKNYLKRVSSHGQYHSSLGATGSHMFECLLLVGIDMDNVTKDKVPYLIKKYPPQVRFKKFKSKLNDELS